MKRGASKNENYLEVYAQPGNQAGLRKSAQPLTFTLGISEYMKIYIPILVLASILLSACGNDTKSQLIVLYRSSVEPGNSVVSFINKNDGTGQYATTHCENLKSIYMEKEKIIYICSTIVFDEFKPSIK